MRRTILFCAAVLSALAIASCSDESVETTEDRVQPPQGIQRVAVPSTVIPTVGYDADRRILEIEFHNGAVYQYFGVPQYVYEDLTSAETPGRYFNQHIRNQFTYRQVAVGGRAVETVGLRNSDEHEQNH